MLDGAAAQLKTNNDKGFVRESRGGTSALPDEPAKQAF
jgi:hypothetical protein